MKKPARRELLKIYRKLYKHFGPQHWWPADTPLEVIIGAILTQNTSWSNVERAVANLRKAGLLSFRKLKDASAKTIARLIRPSGYYNIKARRLKRFLEYLEQRYQGNLAVMKRQPLRSLRHELLGVYGIGPETADSILLYALGKPSFVVDAYTKRIFSRHGFLAEDAAYQEIQDFFIKNFAPDVRLFNEYHALLVKLAKAYCQKTKPRCSQCPLHKNID